MVNYNHQAAFPVKVVQCHTMCLFSLIIRLIRSENLPASMSCAVMRKKLMIKISDEWTVVRAVSGKEALIIRFQLT